MVNLIDRRVTGLSVSFQDPKGKMYLSKSVNEGKDLPHRTGHEDIFSQFWFWMKGKKLPRIS